MADKPVTIDARKYAIRVLEFERGRPPTAYEIDDLDARMRDRAIYWRKVCRDYFDSHYPPHDDRRREDG